jgi:preprotein translocase subunit SecA
MFQEMVDHLKEIVLEQLFKVRMVREEAPPIRVAAAPPPRWQERHGGIETAPGRPAAADSRLPSGVPAGTKVGRNDPCPCGSGKKYKKCHALNGA